MRSLPRLGCMAVELFLESGEVGYAVGTGDDDMELPGKLEVIDDNIDMRHTTSVLMITTRSRRPSCRDLKVALCDGIKHLPALGNTKNPPRSSALYSALSSFGPTSSLRKGVYALFCFMD